MEAPETDLDCIFFMYCMCRHYNVSFFIACNSVLLVFARKSESDHQGTNQSDESIPKVAKTPKELSPDRKFPEK
jgi:hypothetical protein